MRCDLLRQVALLGEVVNIDADQLPLDRHVQNHQDARRTLQVLKVPVLHTAHAMAEGGYLTAHEFVVVRPLLKDLESPINLVGKDKFVF